MIFRPDLAEKVMAGEKTVTRRMPSPNPRSPWYRGDCAFVPGRDYAVQPGRGKDSVGRLVVVRVDLVRLGFLTPAEARREGFPSVTAFVDAWTELHGHYLPLALVWRVEFRVAEAVAA